MRFLWLGTLGLAIAFTTTLELLAEQQVRVASYNIYFLTKNIKDERADNLRQTIAELNADVIGLQEIKDRDALELVFDPNEWSLVIDDDSGDDQDVALAVRKPLKVVNLNDDPEDLDADNDDFLFPQRNLPNDPYPNRRDALAVEVAVPGGTRFHVIVHHWKSRFGGRAVSDPRREDAARLLVQELESRYDGKNVFIVGDFNDNPDDRSLNILEAGEPNAIGGPEAIDGPLLINLMEPLVAQDIVSHGVMPSSATNGRLNPAVAGSRDKNNVMRGQDGHSGPILFDQILIPVHMKDLHVSGSTKVFDGLVARQGDNPADTAASDHLPVYADFVFDDSSMDAPTDDMPMPIVAEPRLRIVGLLPNPSGEDRGKEKVWLKNTGDEDIDLAGWKLRDRAGNILNLDGNIEAGEELAFTDSEGAMPLNNDGDEIVVVNPAGNVVDRFSYPRSAVSIGQVINR